MRAGKQESSAENVHALPAWRRSSRGEPPLLEPSRLDPLRLDEPPRLDESVVHPAGSPSSAFSTWNALADVCVRMWRCMLHAMLKRRPQLGYVHANAVRRVSGGTRDTAENGRNVRTTFARVCEQMVLQKERP